MKKLFKSIGSENANFKVKEKCLLKCKFIIKKACKENNNIESDESFESNESIGEEELKFIMENDKEYI